MELIKIDLVDQAEQKFQAEVDYCRYTRGDR